MQSQIVRYGVMSQLLNRQEKKNGDDKHDIMNVEAPLENIF